MNFANSFARALVPVALVATVAAPAPAATSGDLKAVEASLAATQSMTANFLQTDGKGRQMAGTLQPQAPGQDPLRLWRRGQHAAGRQRQDAELHRL